MRKLALKCNLAPGDIVMLTAAVRDLHHWYPNQFLTDVRTVCPDLWEHNPHLMSLPDNDPETEQIECSYPLINRCNETPYHCLHGFIEFLNQRLHLAIKPTAFRGDIHLSAQEKAWYSQVHEVTGEDIPFWLIAAGGKYDITIKWWQTERYQKVVDHFRGRIQFVQVGDYGHHHPKLDRVIDLRGKTNLRELIRLVYHAQGVLCSVTALMHLAAAVETKRRRPANRPCVVVAGGREPAHWEAYPDHQFVHTNGALACCAKGGCWRDRTMRLRDGDPRDRPDHLCLEVHHGLPRCMDLITPEEIIRRIELYFSGGVLKYLTPRQKVAAEKGVRSTARNRFDHQGLNLHNAGLACERFIHTIPTYPAHYQGRGIVLCCGGVRPFVKARVCVERLRHLGCRLPVQLWHLRSETVSRRMDSLLTELGAECVDASRIREFPKGIRKQPVLKPYALLHSPFQEVLLLDGDRIPATNPESLFETHEFQTSGALFWPEGSPSPNRKARAIWRSCGLRQPREQEFGGNQIAVDKRRCWRALRLALWFNENSDFYYQFLNDDRETFHLAFRKLHQRYSLVRAPIQSFVNIVPRHGFARDRLFQHRNANKKSLVSRSAKKIAMGGGTRFNAAHLPFNGDGAKWSKQRPETRADG